MSISFQWPFSSLLVSRGIKKGGIHFGSRLFFEKVFGVSYSSVLVFAGDSVFTVSVVSDFSESAFFVSIAGAFFPP